MITPFDQGSSPTNFRTTAFPTIAIDNNGQIVVAWSQRGAGPSGAARIMISTSSDGAAWSTPAVADPAFAAFNAQLPFPGHQIMPVLSNVGGTVMLMYYDLRDTYTYGQYTYGPDGTLSDNRVLAVPASPLDFNSIINPFISDATNPGVLGSPMLARRQTLDVRASQRISVMGFSPSVKVSKYVIGTTPYTDQNYPGVCNGTSPCQLQFHAPNLPLFALGSIPFIGDYIDLGAQTIVPDGAGGWQFNQTPPGAAVAHAVWTDNRDVRPPRDGDWTKYTPIKPAGPSLYDPTQTTYTCDPMKAGMRNQNIYTSRIMTGRWLGRLGIRSFWIPLCVRFRSSLRTPPALRRCFVSRLRRLRRGQRPLLSNSRSIRAIHRC